MTSFTKVILFNVMFVVEIVNQNKTALLPIYILPGWAFFNRKSSLDPAALLNADFDSVALILFESHAELPAG